MRICASLNSLEEKDEIGKADMVEIRLDLLDDVPDISSKDMIVTYRGDIDLSILPDGFDGLIDVGENEPPSGMNVISSHHNFIDTPDCSEIISILDKIRGDVAKGAFTVNTFTDLHNIHRAATSMRKKHVILGMGEMGTITRIREKILGNEFTFAYVRKPTAPGQLSLDVMDSLRDDCIVTGIVGYPLSRSLSPMMHGAAMKDSNINGIYLKFETDNLEHIGDVIREYDIRGLNVTTPHKENIIKHLDCIDKDASEISAVNTIVNDDGTLRGYNTDVLGVDKALTMSEYSTKGGNALVMGYGGAARACVYHLLKNGCGVTIVGRNDSKASDFSKSFGCEWISKSNILLERYDLIVNSTPAGMYGSSDYPMNIDKLTSNHTVFDMVYGGTPLTEKAKNVGSKIAYGEDMLAAQGSASFELWTGVKNTFDVMRGCL